jgi:hypothetical protein
MSMRAAKNGVDLALAIASLMQANHDLSARLRQAGVSSSDLTAAREWTRALGLLSGLPERKFRDLFGAPETVAGDCMSYALRFWREHLFDVVVNSEGHVFYRGFRLRAEHRPTPGSEPLEMFAAAETLRVGWHTESECHTLLGQPAQSFVWTPVSEWFYGPLPSDLYLTFSFDFGLLSSISFQPFIDT